MRIRNGIVETLAVILFLCLQSGSAQDRPMTAEADLVKELELAVAKGGYEEGVAMLKQKVEAEPLNPAARFFLATAYQAKGANSACIEEVRAAERLEIIDDRLLGILWVCLYESGREPEALKTAAQAVARFPGSGESHRWYGVSLLDENKDAEATSHFQKAIAIDPGDSASLYMLAQLYRSRGYVVPSFLTYLRFFTVEPEGNRANKARAQLLEMLKSELLIHFEDETKVVLQLSVGPDGPIDEGDFREAQKRIAVYAAPNSRSPDLTPSKLEKTLQEVLKALPDKGSVPEGSFILHVTAPFFAAAQDAGLSRGLADLVLMSGEPTAGAVDFLKWSTEYKWPSRKAE